MERQSSNPGGAKENFFCCFWISSPRVSLCFSARVALKCLTVQFSMLIERSLLPAAQHFFRAAHKPCSAMQLPGVLCPSAALQSPGPAPGMENEGISAKRILLTFDRLRSCESSEAKNRVLMALNSAITLSGLGVKELVPAGKLPWGQLKEIAEQRWCLGTPCPCRQCWLVAVTDLPWDISSITHGSAALLPTDTSWGERWVLGC